ncbi:unnamed protein product [Cyclocybe aegerita]|uniref:F-box domain-containing protein n=1 Tax=Cyclocybe aegerita TaxID=1973307 RepID=A0A8S0W4L2_CYCAE|nr:unnamed protein product [Cyclocybe aegerita]
MPLILVDDVSRLELPPTPERSPIACLLTHNDPPGSHERGIARQVIASSLSTLQQVEAVMVQNVLSISRHLPNDVLSEIFLHITANYKDSKTWCEEIWAITQVSRRWRLAALLMPRLWTVFPTFDAELRKGGRNLYPLHTSLERSGSVPFNLTVEHFDCNFPSEKPFLECILPHLHRVEHLNLRDPRSTFDLSNIEKTSTLKSISLTGSLDVSNPRKRPLVQLQDAPLLRELTIFTKGCSAQSRSLQVIAVPWPRLRRVSICELDLNCAASLLQSATSLEECVLYPPSLRLSPPLPTPPLSSNSVTMLSVDACFSGALDTFFAHATFPSLRKLSTSFGSASIKGITEFILRSSYHLEFLTLPFEDHPVREDVVRLLSLVPDVTDLGIINDSFRIDSVLNIGPPHQPLLPKLRRLFVSMMDLSHFITDVDPATLRGRDSPGVQSGTVAALETIILQQSTRRHRRDELFRRLDDSPKTSDEDRERVSRWITQLRQLCLPREAVSSSLEVSRF